MCWGTAYKKNTVRKVAKKNITVFKILNASDNKICSPCYGFYWELNKEYETRLKSPDYLYYIDIGFHSLKELPAKMSTPVGWCWATVNGRILFRETSEDVYKCIIPKGSHYYLNEHGEYVSDKLIIKEKVT